MLTSVRIFGTNFFGQFWGLYYLAGDRSQPGTFSRKTFKNTLRTLRELAIHEFPNKFDCDMSVHLRSTRQQWYIKLLCFFKTRSSYQYPLEDQIIPKKLSNGKLGSFQRNVHKVTHRLISNADFLDKMIKIHFFSSVFARILYKLGVRIRKQRINLDPKPTKNFHPIESKYIFLHTSF